MPFYLWTPEKACLLSATDSAPEKNAAKCSKRSLTQLSLGFLQPNVTLQQLVTSSRDLTGTAQLDAPLLFNHSKTLQRLVTPPDLASDLDTASAYRMLAEGWTQPNLFRLWV